MFCLLLSAEHFVQYQYNALAEVVVFVFPLGSQAKVCDRRCFLLEGVKSFDVLNDYDRLPYAMMCCVCTKQYEVYVLVRIYGACPGAKHETGARQVLLSLVQCSANLYTYVVLTPSTSM